MTTYESQEEPTS